MHVCSQRLNPDGAGHQELPIPDYSEFDSTPFGSDNDDVWGVERDGEERHVFVAPDLSVVQRLLQLTLANTWLIQRCCSSLVGRRIKRSFWVLPPPSLLCSGLQKKTSNSKVECLLTVEVRYPQALHQSSGHKDTEFNYQYGRQRRRAHLPRRKSNPCRLRLW